MSRSVLFGYSVELDEGKIVISLSGSMASAIFNRMATSRWHRGRGARTLLPLEWLGSAAVSLGPLLAQANAHEESDLESEAEGDGPPDLKEVFGQGFDSSFDEFESRLLAYRELMADKPSAADSPDMTPEPAAAEQGEGQPEGRPRRSAKGAAAEL